MASCSAAWFVERYLRPSTIDKQIDRMLRGSILHAALQRFYVRLPSAIPGADRVTEANVEAAVVLMRECVIDAVETGLRIEAGDLDRRELEQGAAARSRAARPRRGVLRLTARPTSSRGVVPVVRARARSRGERQDRPRRRRADGRAGHRDRLQVGRGVLGRRHPRSRPAPAAALHARAAPAARARAGWGRLRPRRRRAEAARHAPRREPTRCQASAAATTSSPTTSTRLSRKPGRPPSVSSSASAAGMSGTTRRAATARTGATCGRFAGRLGRDGVPQRPAARGDRGARDTSSSRRARARARPPCSSRDSSGPSWTTGSTSTPSS